MYYWNSEFLTCLNKPYNWSLLSFPGSCLRVLTFATAAWKSLSNSTRFTFPVWMCLNAGKQERDCRNDDFLTRRNERKQNAILKSAIWVYNGPLPTRKFLRYLCPSTPQAAQARCPIYRPRNSGAPRARGAPLLRKCGNPSMWENLVL